MGKRNRTKRRPRTQTGSRDAFHRRGAGAQAAGARPPTTPADEVRSHVSMAVLALNADQLSAYDDHIVVLAARCDQPASRATVVSVIRDMIAERLALVWDGGWQPADIHRIATRRSTKTVADFTVQVIRHDLSRFARDTVHPDWWAQVAELRADGRAASDPLAAGRAAGLSWLGVIDAAVRSIHLLSVLPRIERITPTPGTWVGRGGAPVSEVDERILTRVRMLLAKAESTPYEAEAETFTAGAASLIAKHRIDEALLAADQGPEGLRDGASARRIGIDNPYEQPKAQLLHVVAQANSCRTVWSRELGFATVIGFASDLDGVELLFTSLLVQATRTMTATGQKSLQGAHRRSRSFRSAFLTSFALRIGERLQQATEEEERRAGVDHGAPTGSRLPALIEREHRVEEAVSELFPQVVKTRSRATFDAEGWHQGRRAADDASMDVRTKLDRAAG